RPELADLPSYVAGKRPRNADSVKLSSNEVPFPPTPAVAAALAAAVAQGGELNRYPDMSCAQLTAALATYENWDPAGIVVGNGSTALIEKFLQAVVTPGGDVVSPWRS
ncbi:aminotransferase class I/II-fold pyridoxal phosphate-dependent enzyme, partial [Streptococcus anginosus]|nr:aminotransferase class I/II-fold pyridoxal phosphate-dependent enzyme [Streptococcus anginosus]